MTERPATPMLTLAVEDLQTDHEIDIEALGALLCNALQDQGVAGPSEVGLRFVDSQEMAELNRVHMDKDGPTDVLAFPIDGATSPPHGQAGLVGDIVICPAVAQSAGQRLADELELLVVHGALHLLGHDHAEPAEAQVMQGLERSLLARYGRA